LDMGIISYACSPTTCLSDFINLSNGTHIQEALCHITSANGSPIMVDSSGRCVTVSKNARTIVSNSVSGSYLLSYVISFDGDTLRGNVPQLVIKNTNLTYSSSATFVSTLSGYSVGDARSAGLALTVRKAVNPSEALV